MGAFGHNPPLIIRKQPPGVKKDPRAARGLTHYGHAEQKVGPAPPLAGGWREQGAPMRARAGVYFFC